MSKFSTKNLAMWLLIATAFCLPISTAATNILFATTALLTFINLCQTNDWPWLLKHPVVRYLLGFTLLFFIGIWYSQADLIEASARFSKHLKFLYAALFLWLFCDKKVTLHALTAFMAAMILWLILCYLKIAGV